MADTYHYLGEHFPQRPALTFSAPRPSVPRLTMAQRVELARWEKITARPKAAYKRV